MTTTTPNTTRRPVPKSINDFGRLGLIGGWFGDLQLVSVQRPRYAAGDIRNTVCRVTCAKGHRSSRAWWELRDQSRKQTCAKCRAPKPKPPVTNPSNEELLKKIDELPPERRRLFDALMNSRRRTGDQDETAPKDLLNDAYSYATVVKDPEGDLRDLLADGGYETYGRSASLCSPNWIYAGGE